MRHLVTLFGIPKDGSTLPPTDTPTASPKVVPLLSPSSSSSSSSPSVLSHSLSQSSSYSHEDPSASTLATYSLLSHLATKLFTSAADGLLDIAHIGDKSDHFSVISMLVTCERAVEQAAKPMLDGGAGVLVRVITAVQTQLRLAWNQFIDSEVQVNVDT